MINYELAKKLKDAGFVQHGKGNFINEFNSLDTLTPAIPVPIAGAVYAPTLSELIEACGWNLWNLDQTDEGEWCARGRSKKPMSGLFEFYSTPEEAVANLWLALNKKA